MFNPTPEQQDIFSWTRERGNLVIAAVAGSGKTTTLVEFLRRLPLERDPQTLMPPAVTFLAFNKSIAETLQSRCPRGVACSTFHSLGLRALKQVLPPADTAKRDFVDGRKVAKLVWNRMKREDPDVQSVIKLVSLLKSQTTVGDPAVLAARYDLDIADDRSLQIALSVLEESNRNLKTIDFDDMLYLAVKLDAPFAKQDWVFVDEAQDTNDIQLEILERLDQNRFSDHKQIFPNRPTTTYVFVGDPFQAIYGFRGANADSMQRIATRFACSTLPLSYSFRCPKAVVREARKYLTQNIE